MKTYFLIALILTIYNTVSFDFENQQQKQREVSLCRMTGYFKNFYLKMNNDFVYQEKNQTKGNGAFGYFITKYKAVSDTLHIYLKINNEDTAFNYILSNYDSLMLGKGGGCFFCWTKKEYIWAED